MRVVINLTPEWRYSIYYAALFASIGSIAPFFAVWLDSLGIDAGTIGIIAAAPSVAMVFTTVLISRWADGLRERRIAIIVCNVLILLTHLILFWPVNSWLILVVWTFSGILMHASVPVTDAAAIRLTDSRNTDYARVRVYGSIGFIVAVALGGYVYEAFGMAAFVPALLLGNLLRLWLSSLLPRESHAHVAAESEAEPDRLSSGAGIYHAGVLLTIVGSSLIQASHAVVYIFGILLWSQQQIPESTGSLLFAAGVVAEVFVMWRFRTLTKKISARVCLLIAAVCGVVRWVVLALSPPLVVIYAAQVLHGATFGLTFLATAIFIARRAGEENAARGQGLSATVMTALMAVATYVSGHYFDELGMQLYWIMAGLCGLSIVCLLFSYTTNLERAVPVN